MKPDWDKLGDKFAGSDDILIADVDCTTDDGKPVCSKYGVRGYPTIRTFGSNPMGEDYKGGRKYADLLKHVEDNMGPSCGPANKDKCSAEELKELEVLLALPTADREAKVKEVQEKMDKISSDFDELVQGLQTTYSEAQTKKDEETEALAPQLKMLYASLKGDDAKTEL